MKNLLLIFTMMLVLTPTMNVFAVNTVTPAAPGISILGAEFNEEVEQPKKRKKKKKKKGKSGPQYLKVLKIAFFSAMGLSVVGLGVLIAGIVAIGNDPINSTGATAAVGWLMLILFGALTSLLGLAWLIAYFVSQS